MAKYDMMKPHSKVLKILGILREWFFKHKEGMHTEKEAASKVLPHGRNPHGVPGESKLQVLSEAATAGSGGSDGQSANKSKPVLGTWTYDSPNPLPYPSGRFGGEHVSGSADTYGPSRHDTSSNVSSYAAPPSTGMYPTPEGQSIHSDAYNSIFSPNGGADNLDWAAGMDLEQVLDGAFRDFDMSGDLGGWFMGDGVGAYQIPAEGAQSMGNAKW